MADSQLTTMKSGFRALEDDVHDLCHMAAITTDQVLEASMHPSQDELNKMGFAVVHLQKMVEAFREKYLAAAGFRDEQDRAA
jgi:hypothetical protein